MWSRNGRELFYKLVEKADVFLSNFQMEILRAWGLTWEKLREINPRLVYATNTGYGHALEINRPSYDINVQALTGIMTRQGEMRSMVSMRRASAARTAAGTSTGSTPATADANEMTATVRNRQRPFHLASFTDHLPISAPA